MENLNFQNALQHTLNYAKEIANLAARGAKLIVLPERAININKETDSASTAILSNAAKQNHVTIVAGYTNYKSENLRNSALVIDAAGNVHIDYDKSHLVKGLEDQFTPGSEIGLFKFENVNAGVAICKDLDFPQYIRQYGTSQVNVLCVPAWDFIKDDWLHSRMAILRGVESGFSEIRAARLGRLTISDSYGKVNAEADCSSGKLTSLMGSVSVNNIETPYRIYGDWFGLVIAISALLFIVLTAAKMLKL
jgi:apolipoprotein N-acyltransferase